MAVNLLKGQKISLNKGNPNLKNIDVTLGWRLESGKGEPLPDLDVSVFLLNATGKVGGPKDFVFYGNLMHPSGAVALSNNTSRNFNDYNVRVKVDLGMIPTSIMRVAFTVTIYEAELRKQSFSQVNDAFIRISEEQSNNEILRYNITERFSAESAVVFGEIYRNNDEWKFKAMGNGFTGGLAALCGSYGVEVG